MLRGRASAQAANRGHVLFDKLGWWKEIVEDLEAALGQISEIARDLKKGKSGSS